MPTPTIIYPARAKAAPYSLGQAAEQILTAFAIYPMLDAEQVCRLYYARGSLRWPQTILKQLADHNYLLRLPNSRPLVFALAARGRHYLTRRKLPIRHRFRPSEAVNYSPFFQRHTLAINDVLIAAEKLEQRAKGIRLDGIEHEYGLSSRRIQVQLPDGKKTRLTPDGWLDFALPEQKQRVSIVLELDRHTEKQAAWRRKVSALLAFALVDAQGTSPYQRAFGSDSLTIAVVALSKTEHWQALKRWTEHELEAVQLTDAADLFLFTGLNPAHTGSETFFLAPHWYRPFSTTAETLLPILEGSP